MNRVEIAENKKKNPDGVSGLFKLAADTDVVLRSSDCVRFHVRSSDLSRYSEGFPDSDTAQARGEEDVVQLEESSEVLTLLLQLTRRQIPPDLSLISSQRLLGLADALEKYQVHQAAVICKYEIAKRLLNPSDLSVEEKLHILQYSFSNGYKDIADQIAPTTLALSEEVVRAAVSALVLTAWFRYREGWLGLVKYALDRPNQLGFRVLHKGGCGLLPECTAGWYQFQYSLANRLWEFEELDVDKLVKDYIGFVQGCHHCNRTAEKLGRELQANAEAISRFSQFM